MLATESSIYGFFMHSPKLTVLFSISKTNNIIYRHKLKNESTKIKGTCQQLRQVIHSSLCEQLDLPLSLCRPMRPIP